MSNVFKNLSSNLFLYVAKLGIGILTLPICLKAFGADTYGLFLLAFGLSSSFTAFDFGASKSAMRFSVEFLEDKETIKFSRALSTSITLSVLAAICISLIFLGMGFYGKQLFHLTGNTATICLPVFLLAAANSFFLVIGAVPQQLLQANNFFSLRNNWQYICQALNLIALIALWRCGINDVILYSIAIVFISIISLLIDITLISRKMILVGTKLQFKIERKRTSVSQYSFRAFLHAIISFLAVQADKLIIGTVLNVGAVTTYSIITKPYYLLRGMTGTGYAVFQPTLTALQFNSDKSTYLNYSSKIIRTTFIVVMSICCVAGICFEQGLTIWLKTSQYNEMATWGIISLVSVCLTMLYTPFYRTMLYTSSLQTILNFSMLVVPINVVISILLTRAYGFYGVIIGTLIQILLESGFVLFQARKLFNLKYTNIFTKPFNFRFLSILIIFIIGRFCIANITTSGLLISTEIMLVSTLILISLNTIRKEGLFSQPINNGN